MTILLSGDNRMKIQILKYRAVWFVELFSLVSDVLLIVFCYKGTLFHMGVALLCDFLLLSPLCAGKAIFYSTLNQDSENASYKLLFRYYRYGYGKSLQWRAILWLKGLQTTIVCSIPIALLAFVRQRVVDNSIAWLSLSLLYRFCIFASVLLTVLVMLYWRPTVHLLPYVKKATHAFSAYKQVYKKDPDMVWEPYRYLFGRLPFVFLVLPLFYLLPQLHLQQSKNIQKCFGISCEKKCEEVLKLSKRYGIIGGISLKH